MRRLLIALLLVASCAAPQASQTGSTAADSAVTERWQLDPDCTGTVEHDTHTVTCGDRFVISRTLVSTTQDWSQEEIVLMTLATLRKGTETVGQTSHRQPAQSLNVNGGSGYTMRLETKVEGAEARIMAMTTFAQPLNDDQVVGVLCLDLQTADDTTRCEELSPWFARDLPDLEFVDVSRPLTFAGRVLSASPGCDTERDNTIFCSSGAEILWYQTPTDDDPLEMTELVHAAIVDANKKRTKSEPKVTSEAFDCALDGYLGRCVLHSYDFDGSTLYVLIGAGQVREQEVGVLCDWTDALTDEVPLPCTLIVDPAPPSREIRAL